jgi:hypothetical protein
MRSMHNKVTTWLKGAMAALIIAAPSAHGFSLLGPFTTWQVQGLGYQFGEDIGGPMNLREGFRWNVPLITYAVDKSFLDYFGPDGVNAIDEAFSYFNDLDSASKISPDLSEYSTSTIRENYEAGTLALIDLKSAAMTVIMEELGFADPIRYTFTLRSRTTETIGGVTYTNYVTIMRNFDPVTLQPSRYVNGTLYTYQIQEFIAPFNHADALEVTAFGNDDLTAPVASGLGHLTFNGVSDSGPATLFTAGRFRTGLTRDDVGGYRFLYHPNNIAIEGLLTNVTASLGTPGGGWTPWTGLTNQSTNTIIITGTNLTNLIVNIGPRGGRNKLKFKRVFYDYLIGQTFTAITNEYTDVTVSSNLIMVVQSLQRGITAPDFVFVAEDLGLIQNLLPAIIRRTGTAGWADNDLLNGVDETDQSNGPGVIQPQVRISFTDQLPYFENVGSSSFLDGFPGEDEAFFSGVWGSFDGSTNPPVIYPAYNNLSLPQLRREILQGSP